MDTMDLDQGAIGWTLVAPFRASLMAWPCLNCIMAPAFRRRRPLAGQGDVGSSDTV